MHELNFIPLSYRKNVVLPKVIIEPDAGQPYCGYYIAGVIVVVADSYLASNLAHEYRHYLQDYYGCVRRAVAVNYEDTSCENYNNFIRRYYRSSWSEMDALRFERKIAPSDLSKFWLEGLVLPAELPTNLCM